MSSRQTRVVIRDVMTSEWVVTPWYDLSDYVSVDDIPLPDVGSAVFLQFMGGTDDMVTIAGTGGEDGYREDGMVYLHYVTPTGFGSMDALVEMEQLRDIFKNKRFGDVVIESITPFTDFDGASIEINGPWKGWSAAMFYYTDTSVL